MGDRKKTEAKKVFKVGLFFVIGIIIAMFALFSIAQKKNLFEPQYQLYTNFKEVGGLRVGSPVRIAGVNVGTVMDIDFSQSLAKKSVDIEMNVTTSAQDKIRSDSVATIKTIGLLGDQYIDISFGSPEAFILENHGTVISAEPYILSEFLKKGDTVLDNLGNASSYLTNILSKIDSGQGIAGSMINDPTKYKTAIKNVSETAESLKDIIDSIKKGEGSIGQLVRDNKLYDNLESSTKSLSDVLAKIESGEGTLGKMLQDEGLYDTLKTDLKSASGSLSKFTKDLEESKGPLSSLLNDSIMKFKIQRSVDNIHKASNSLKSITEKIDNGEGTLGALVNDKTVYNDLKRILEGAKKSWVVRFFSKLGKKGENELKKQSNDNITATPANTKVQSPIITITKVQEESPPPIPTEKKAETPTEMPTSTIEEIIEQTITDLPTETPETTSTISNSEN
jgi:phospholipid/cholesterol/gamma-HCH transport system substrate-binding protein